VDYNRGCPSIQKDYLKNNGYKKAGTVAQGIGPGLKPQYHKKIVIIKSK
jgi:hypothetical protein